jgi:hypothetical protein
MNRVEATNDNYQESRHVPKNKVDSDKNVTYIAYASEFADEGDDDDDKDDSPSERM